MGGMGGAAATGDQGAGSAGCASAGPQRPCRRQRDGAVREDTTRHRLLTATYRQCPSPRNTVGPTQPGTTPERSRTPGR